jgi:hypothetical protein
MAQAFSFDKPWMHSYEEILDAGRVEADSGLDAQEVRRRRAHSGPNRLRHANRKSMLAIPVSFLAGQLFHQVWTMVRGAD